MANKHGVTLSVGCLPPVDIRVYTHKVYSRQTKQVERTLFNLTPFIPPLLKGKGQGDRLLNNLVDLTKSRVRG